MSYDIAMAMSCSYFSYESPVGVLFVASDGYGVTDLAIGGKESDFIRGVASRRAVAPAFDSGRFPSLIKALDGYFLGNPVSFDVPLNPSGSVFDKLVWNALTAVPWGMALSYGELAEAIGKPNASRAVGGACARNPIPIIIPCHRVLQAGGSLGGYSGGEGVKEKLLILEGIAFKSR